MANYSKFRTLVSGIPTTIDLIASGSVLQAADVQFVNAGIDASKPVKLDGDKKIISAYIANADVDASAAIVESKLNLDYATGTLNTSITNHTGNTSNPHTVVLSDVVAGTLVANADVDTNAAIALSKLAAVTASRALVSDGSGFASASSVTATELGYVSGVTSGIQTQLNAISSGYNRRKKVLSYIIDNTADPVALETNGNRYILSHDGGSPHAGFDGAAANDIVEFVTDTWVATTPEEGWVTYNDDDDKDYLQVDDGTPQWESRATQSTSLTDGKIWMGNASNEATAVTVSGDFTISNSGVGAIASGVIVNADVKSDAAIVESKLSLDYATGTLNTAITNHTSDTNNPHTVVLADVVAGTLVANADVDASAAIVESKLSLDYATGTLNTAITNHVNTVTGNPHVVTKTEVSLGNVDNVQQLPMSYLDTDVDLAADSDVKVPSQKAVKAYIDSVGQQQIDFTGVAGEVFAANSTFVVRKAVSGETAGRIYKCTSDEENAPGKHYAIGFVQTTTEISVAASCIVIKFKSDIALKSADTVLGVSAADQGKPIFLNKAGAFSLDPDAGIVSDEKYASRIVGILDEYNASAASEKITMDVAAPAFFGIDLGA